MYDQPDKNAELLRDLDEAEEKRARLAEAEKAKEVARRRAKQSADEEEEALRHIVSVRASEIPIKRTTWLWRDRIQIGALSLVAGRGGVAKSTLFAQLVAWITTGKMHGDFYGIPQDVAYVVNEESLSEVVVPRFVAHGADLERIHILATKTPMNLAAIMMPRDAEILREFIINNRVIAMFIDPLSANTEGRRNDQGDMRNTYQQINGLAEKTHIAIIGLAHTRKAASEDILEAIMGSSEQVNVARSVHGLALDNEEDGARILSCEKLNRRDRTSLPSLRFKLDTVLVPCTDGTGDASEQPRIRWIEETTDSASDMLNDHFNNINGIDRCAVWLDQYLINQGGEAYAADVQEAAAHNKFHYKMLIRAKTRIGVTSERQKKDHGPAVWRHPAAKSL